MTSIEKKICEEIKNNFGKVKLFWDMDGTCASMEMHKRSEKMEQGFFSSKRPIKTIVNIMKKFHDLGGKIYIISFCSYNFQVKDKLEWLKVNCSFIEQDNIIIIPRREPSIKRCSFKQTLKAEYLKDYISKDEIVYLIDDNESVLVGTKDILPFVNIVSPIDFIE